MWRAHVPVARLRPLLAFALCLSFFQQGCFDDEKGEQFYGRVAAPATQEFRWSDGGLPRVFDPAVAASPPDTDAVRALFEGLTDYDPRTLEPIPAVARSWESAEGGRVWTFHLRADSRWTNGDPVTAHDFVRSWKRTLQLGERSPHSRLLSNIEGAAEPLTTPPAEGQAQPASTPADVAGQPNAGTTPTPLPADFGAVALDDRTLRVRLVRPDENFPALVSHPVFRPVHELGAHTDINPQKNSTGTAERLEETLISNGAFRLAKAAGSAVVLEKDSAYWDAGTVQLERVAFVATSDAEEALAAYRAGEVDAVTNAAFEPLALKLLAPYKDFRRGTYGALTFYQFNAARAPFTDRRVREALALALDVERLSADVMGGATIPARRFIPRPEGIEDAQAEAGKDVEDAKGIELKFDPERARQLFAEAGYQSGESFPVIRLLVNRNEQQRLLANAVASMWRSTLNVQTEVVLKAWDEYEAALKSGDYDVARRSLVMQTLDETTNLIEMFGEAAPAPAAADDAEGQGTFAQPGSVETKVAEANPSGPANNAKPLYASEQAALKDLPAVPIYFATSFSLVKPYVEGFHTNLLDAPSLKTVSIVRGWTPHAEAQMLRLGGL